MSNSYQNMARAYIAFGANLANPRDMFLRVVEALAGEGVVIDDASPLYRSPAWPPGSGAPDYLNAVLSVRTALEPEALMSLLLEIEGRLGRQRSVPNAPRVVDLDLVDMPGEVRATAHLTLPHPRMHERDFVLLPLRDVAPDWIGPDGRSVFHLIEALPSHAATRIAWA